MDALKKMHVEKANKNKIFELSMKDGTWRRFRKRIYDFLTARFKRYEYITLHRQDNTTMCSTVRQRVALRRRPVSL